MKKIIALVLSLLLVVSLAACSGQKATEGSGTNTDQTETTEPKAGETTNQEESSEPAGTEPAFDPGWAGNGYVMPIPEPPFAYEITADGTAVKIQSANGGVDGDVTHQAILDYCEKMKEAGFTLKLSENELGERNGRMCYEFSASDDAGNNVNLIDDGFGVAIYLSLAKTSGEILPVFDTSWASNGYEKLIPKPPFEGWTGEKTSERVYEMETAQARAEDGSTGYDIWEQYLQTLRDCGFTVTGDTYSAEGKDSNGNRVELRCGDGYAWITIMTAKADSAATAQTDG